MNLQMFWLLQGGDVWFYLPFPSLQQILKQFLIKPLKNKRPSSKYMREKALFIQESPACVSNLYQLNIDEFYFIQTKFQALSIKLCAWESKTEITGSSSWLWNKESHRPLAVELVGGCCDDNQLAAGVDWGGGGASVDTVGGSPEVLSVGAWPGVIVASAVGHTVMVNTSAAPVDVSPLEVCPCVRVMDSLGTSSKAEECH